MIALVGRTLAPRTRHPNVSWPLDATRWGQAFWPAAALSGGVWQTPKSGIRKSVFQWACRAVSRFLSPCGWQSFISTGHYCPALATYPRVKRSGPLLLSYLVLLRVGFALPAGLLRPRCALTAPFHPYLVRGGIFSVALSVKSALSGSPRPLAGTLSCGDRTFLPLFRSDHPPGKPEVSYHD